MSSYWKETIKNPPSAAADTTDDLLVPTNEALIRKASHGAAWSLSIAGLSVVNLVQIYFHSPFRYTLGLCATDLIYEIGMAASPVLSYAALGVDATILGFFVFLWAQARKFRIWAFHTTIGLILLDIGILAWVAWMTGTSNIGGFVSHVLAISFLCIGVQAARLYNKRKKDGKT